MLTVDSLGSGYGLSPIIHGCTFGLKPQEILGIMGRNGMGKTTLFKTLMGMLPTWAGNVSLDEQSLNKRRPHERVANGIAYVPQGRHVFPTLTVEENILAGLEVTSRRAVPEDIYSLFPVLLEMRKRRAGNLSGGQQQQLAIARALAADPKVLLLDEPTEGIQPSIIKEMARSLKEIRDIRGVSILFSEQVLSFSMAVADRVLVIDRGNLVEEFSGAELSEERMTKYLSV
jgi:urea transport system ATP-binding protein